MNTRNRLVPRPIRRLRASLSRGPWEFLRLLVENALSWFSPDGSRLFRQAWIAIQDRWFDVVRKTDTADHPSIAQALRAVYAAARDGGDPPPRDVTDAGSFRRMMRRLPVDPTRFTFVDYGCGKGRCLLLAAEAGFGRIVGIDRSAEAIAVARRNVRKLGAKAAAVRRIECVHGDAADLSVPDGPLVLYLFNPFGAEQLDALWGRVRESLEREGREAFLVYYNPVHSDRLRLDGRLEILDSGEELLAAYGIHRHQPVGRVRRSAPGSVGDETGAGRSTRRPGPVAVSAAR